MSRIRRLYLQNASGGRFGLNGEKGVYASNLAGLGVTMNPGFADLGRGFFLPVDEEAEPQTSTAFTLTFTRSPYQTYQELVNWIFAAGTVTVIYIPYGEQEYCRDVSLNFLQKGDLNQVGWLETPCSCLCRTPWYKPTPTVLALETSGRDESKRYPYTYSEELRYGSDSAAVLSGTIAGAGHIDGALVLTYYGAIVNPQIRLTGNLSGKTYGVCSVETTLEASDALRLCTRYEKSYASKITAAGAEADLLDALDLSTTPFFHIPVNEPCTVSIEADAPFTGRAELLVYYYYRSV